MDSGKSQKKDTDDKKDDDNGSKSASTSAKEEPKMKTMTVKGKAPVDSFCPIKDSAHVFCSGDDIYDVMLNQTNVQDNDDKYCVIQLLEDDGGKSFSVWQRWGRVGYDGQSNLDPCGADLEKAKKCFYAKFYDKTGNDWENRDEFVKRAGKYDLVLLDYSSKDDKSKDVEEKATGEQNKRPKISSGYENVEGPDQPDVEPVESKIPTPVSIEVDDPAKKHEVEEVGPKLFKPVGESTVINDPDEHSVEEAFANQDPLKKPEWRPESTGKYPGPMKDGDKDVLPSLLPESVQELLEMICDIKAMENVVKEMKYDATKAPLGKLTTAQIKAGYAALTNIESSIEKKDFGSNLTEACNEFYTRIPHFSGAETSPLDKQRLPLIKTQEEIKQKIQLLEALSDIEIAIRTMAAGDEESEKMSPLDRHYDAMKCQLKQLDQNSDTFKLLNNYLTNTHGATHRIYKMELMDAFECEKDGEDGKFKDIGNRMLLWHGSRLTNWYGILSQGLRIAPPEAPVTGYMFGKGVYFADMSSKSANDCFTTPEKNVGLLVLCEVALGKTRDLTNADYDASNLPAGFFSTKGVGRTVPDETGHVTLDNGCVVPCGKPKDVNIPNAYLQYNEYIVYDTSQIKMKYLMKVKFVY